jgi:hypothetical protein
VSERLRRASTLGISLAIAGGLLVFGAPAAHAALPTCYRTTNLDSGHIGPIEVPSAGTTPASTSCLMGRGANSNAVRRLQYTLNVCYGRGLSVDGAFGALTERALKYAQSREGVDNDGVYGPITRDALLWATGPNPAYNCWGVNGPGGG